jgi:hypothetical protein
MSLFLMHLLNKTPIISPFFLIHLKDSNLILLSYYILSHSLLHTSLTMAPSADPVPVPTLANFPPPTHPECLRVNRSTKAFASGAYSLVDLPAGAVFAKITTATPGKKAYTSVQTGRDTHIELNSDLVYCNHSCTPSLVFDMARMEVRVVDDRPLKTGDALTFFYPSTEWDMDQAFQCTCGAGEGVCRGYISGAKNMSSDQLKGYWLNDHISELLNEKTN